MPFHKLGFYENFHSEELYHFSADENQEPQATAERPDGRHFNFLLSLSS